MVTGWVISRAPAVRVMVWGPGGKMNWIVVLGPIGPTICACSAGVSVRPRLPSTTAIASRSVRKLSAVVLSALLLTLRPGTRPAGLTLMSAWAPLIDGVTVSVAISDWLPEVAKGAANQPAPPVSVVSAGNVGLPALPGKRTVAAEARSVVPDRV